METNNNEYRLVKAKPRCKKLKPRIDLAAMVSVSFLLIIFFMVTKELAKPQAMDLGLPEAYKPKRGDCIISCGPDFRRITTILLDDDNKVIAYRGLLEVPESGGAPKKFSYGKNGIRKELEIQSKRIPEITGYKDRGAIVIIKPSKNSNFGNLVDILDEMSITNIQTYAIINDFTPEEMKLLAQQ